MNEADEWAGGVQGGGGGSRTGPDLYIYHFARDARLYYTWEPHYQ